MTGLKSEDEKSPRTFLLRFVFSGYLYRIHVLKTDPPRCMLVLGHAVNVVILSQGGSRDRVQSEGTRTGQFHLTHHEMMVKRSILSPRKSFMKRNGRLHCQCQSAKLHEIGNLAFGRY